MSKFVSFRNVDLSAGFWRDRYELNKNVSVENVRKRFEETGRFDALRFNYLKNGKKPHIFYDSDVAKWIEAVAYLAEHDRAAVAKHEKLCDEIIDCMEAAQRDDGYLNSTHQQITPDKIFKVRSEHELYCAGHLIEAAVAYDKATGKDKLLRIMEKYCDCIERAFITEKTAAFVTPGHEEIELALFKLYRHTGNKKYFEMAKFFLENRGLHEEVVPEAKYYAQDDVDIYHLDTAVGHSVRALYLYSGIADLMAETGDATLKANLDAVFDDITKRKMYLTGGVGSLASRESFTVPYDLPNETAYTESCCAVALIMFARRMREYERNVKYGHLIERVLFNSMLSSTSLDGKSFFYENPLAIYLEDRDREFAATPDRRSHMPITQRVECFSCSCCPPNINRFFAEMATIIYCADEDGIAVEQFVASDADTEYGRVKLAGDYAETGKITVSGENYTAKKLSVRIPEWCKAPVSDAPFEIKDGYAVFAVGREFSVNLDFGIAPRFVAADPRVRADAGRVAFTYGPTVYCLEGVDNGERLSEISVSPVDAKNAVKLDGFCGRSVFDVPAYRDLEAASLYSDADELAAEKITARFIPYYAFANRGETSMTVWVRRK